VGLNVWTDDFGTPQPNQSIQPRDRTYNQQIAGVFLQNTVSLSDQFSLETGLRSDVLLTVVPTGSDVRTPRAFLLPRFSLLYRANEHWSSRLGGGLGYKAPTVFTEEAERQLFYRVALNSIDQLHSERSIGANWDINYRVELADETTLSINQLFFYTRLNDPLTLMQINQQYQFKNASGHIDTRGFETNIRFVWKELHAFLGYSFIDTKRHYDGLNDVLPLTARHRLYLTTLYESDRLKTGFEAFYVGRQQRNDGSTTRPFCTMGYMIERKWQWGSVFINFENFLDVRQSRYESLVQGTAQNPQFVTDIYAPTDGRVINAGIKLKL
jgi:iron complex outermembrane receptor protein